MRYIAWHLNNPIRFVGLSTALANPVDLAEWLGIPPTSLYNFNPSVRPVPVDVCVPDFLLLLPVRSCVPHPWCT